MTRNIPKTNVWVQSRKGKLLTHCSEKLTKYNTKTLMHRYFQRFRNRASYRRKRPEIRRGINNDMKHMQNKRMVAKPQRETVDALQ